MLWVNEEYYIRLVYIKKYTYSLQQINETLVFYKNKVKIHFNH